MPAKHARTRTPGSQTWIGGWIEFPASVGSGRERLRPLGFLWLDASGMVLGCAVVKPPASPEVASDSLAEAIEMASSNRIPAPSRVRVDSEETADALRRSHPSIAVECGPIPSLAHLAKDVAQFFDGSLSDLEPLYFPNVRTDDVLRSSTQAFLELHQSRPWSWVPSDFDAFILNFPECGLHDAAICVIGQAGMNRAALIFDSADEFERYIVACVGQDEKSAGSFPKNLSISFDPPSKSVSRCLERSSTDARYDQVLAVREGMHRDGPHAPCDGSDLA